MKFYGNNRLLVGIIVLVVVLGCIVWYGNSMDKGMDKDSMDKDDIGNGCVRDSDCVPKTCCHPSACVSIKNSPDCSDLFCTMECAPGTLDCGQGSCLCIDGKCRAEINNNLK